MTNNILILLPIGQIHAKVLFCIFVVIWCFFATLVNNLHLQHTVGLFLSWF